MDGCWMDASCLDAVSEADLLVIHPHLHSDGVFSAPLAKRTAASLSGAEGKHMKGGERTEMRAA